MDILHILLVLVLITLIICILGSVLYSKLWSIDGFDVTTTTTGATARTTTTSGATGATTRTTMTNTKPLQPERVRILRISDSEFQVHFNYGNLKSINKFIIVLTQYNNEFNIVGEIKMLVSDETPNSGDSMCSSAGAGQSGYKCGFSKGHKFSNLAKLDDNGNNYLYRVGVAAIDNNGAISDFAEPYNVPILGGKRMFTMEKNFKLSSDNLSSSNMAVSTDNVSASPNADFLNEGIDSQYNLLSKQLGGYPYNAVLSSNWAKQNLLSDLVGQSMVNSVVNVQLS